MTQRPQLTTGNPPCSHFNMLTGQVHNKCVLTVSGLISACSVCSQPDPITSSTPPPGGECSRSYIHVKHLSLCTKTQSHNASGIFSLFSERCWMVKLGCQGDTEDVAVTTVQQFNHFLLNRSTVLNLHQIFTIVSSELNHGLLHLTCATKINRSSSRYSTGGGCR